MCAITVFGLHAEHVRGTTGIEVEDQPQRDDLPLASGQP